MAVESRTFFILKNQDSKEPERLQLQEVWKGRQAVEKEAVVPDADLMKSADPHLLMPANAL